MADKDNMEDKDDRVITSSLRPEDIRPETNIRPQNLKDYIGQEKVKDNIGIFIEAAKNRQEALDHVLLYGPPGLGKTTLANIIANEMQVSLRTTSGPAIEHGGDLASILTGLESGDVLFIDEIHRLNRAVEEVLYPAMEDFHIDIIMGKGPGAQTLHLPLAPFTLIGATTRAGMLSAPLRDRFGVISRLEYYNKEELLIIINRSAQVLNVAIEPGGAKEIARRARGTPRVANRLLRRLRDFADIEGNGVITKELAFDGLNRLEIDNLGLDKMDQKVMLTIIEKFAGGPVGLDTIAASISESADTIEDVHEPYLLQLGFIDRTPRGRQATSDAFKYFGYQLPESFKSENLKSVKENSLFPDEENKE